MSYLNKPSTKPLEHRKPFQILHSHVQIRPDKEAFVFRDETSHRTSLTFKEYEDKSIVLAAAFLELGLVKGDKILVILPSCIEFILIHMALNRIGANIIVCEEAFLLIKEFAFVIGVSDFENCSTSREQGIEKIKDGLNKKTMKGVVLFGSSVDPLQGWENVYNYNELFQIAQKLSNASQAVLRAEAEVQMDDPSVVMFTSGSTSIPKPIQYTNFGYVNGVIADASMMLIDENSIFFSAVPFDWITGLMFSIGVVITTGNTLIAFPPKLLFEGGLLAAVKVMEEEHCTHAFLLAYALHDIATHNETFNLSKLRVIFTGGQSAPLALFKQVFQKIPTLSIINIGYGATEINLVGQQLLTRENIDTYDYGTYEAVEGCEFKIVDENGKMSPLNVKGELCVRAPWVQFPDWQLVSVDKSLENGTPKNGWHFTKDGASLDDKGRFRLQGRLDDIIKCATEGIMPQDIECFVLEHPYVCKVCVVGIPDQRLYEKLCACVILTDEKKDSDHQRIIEELDTFCTERCLVSAKGLAWKPHCYVIMEEFPKTRTGKLSRKLTKEKAIQRLADKY